VHWWFLSRPDDLGIVSLLLLQYCVLEVDLFPDFGWSGFARDISRNYIVVGRGRGVFIKRSNSTSQGDDLDYGRGREAFSRVFGRILGVVVMVFVTMFGGRAPQTCQRSGSIRSQSFARPKDGPLKVAGTHRGGWERVVLIVTFRDRSGFPLTDQESRHLAASYLCSF